MNSTEKRFKSQVETIAGQHSLQVNYHKDNYDRSEDRRDEITIDPPDGKHFRSVLHGLVIACQETGDYRRLWSEALNRLDEELPLERCDGQCAGL